MENNNVVSIADTSNTNDVVNVTTTSGTMAIAETAPLTLNNQYVHPTTSWITTTSSYTSNLEVKRAVNGYVVNYQYSTYIDKNEKELNKVIVQLLNPGKGKKNGKKA